MKAFRLPRATLAVVCAVAAAPAVSQTAEQKPATAMFDPVVLTDTGSAERAFDVPAASNGRYFEPAATRNHIGGVSVNVSL